MTAEKILIVDDSPENRLMCSRVLHAAGFEVETAENGVEGVSKAVKGSADLVLMDFEMPRLDGYNAAARLRLLGFESPIVALTAHETVAREDAFRAAGFNECLVKPVGPSQLVDRVRDILQTFRAMPK